MKLWLLFIPLCSTLVHCGCFVKVLSDSRVMGVIPYRVELKVQIIIIMIFNNGKHNDSFFF